MTCRQARAYPNEPGWKARSTISEPRKPAWSSLLPVLWEMAAWIGLRRAYPPLSKIDPVSADIARRKGRYSHPRSKGAVMCDLEQYRRTHEILKRGRA